MAGGTSRERLVIAPAERRASLIELIRSAQRSVSLSIFRCNDEAVLRALVDVAARGVRVRVIMTGRARHAKVALLQVQSYLSRQQVEVRRCPGDVKYHAKFAVIDERVAMVTSGNYTKKCFTRTADFMVLTGDPSVAQRLSALFESDWSGRDVATPDGPHGRLIIGPSHAPRQRFEGLFWRARRRIRLMDAKLDDPEMLATLDAVRANGVTVDVRGERDLGPWEPHGKLLIIDDCLAVIGSMALSDRALSERRELAVVVSDHELVRQLDAFWQSLPPVPPRWVSAPMPEAEAFA